MSLKSKLEALIYAAEEPISLDQMLVLLKDDLQALKSAPAEEPPGESHLGAVEHESGKRSLDKTEKAELRSLLRPVLEELIADYSKEDRGIEVRQVAGGYRMSTKPEHHDVVRAFAHDRIKQFMLLDQDFAEHLVLAQQDGLEAHQLQQRQKSRNQRRARLQMLQETL